MDLDKVIRNIADFPIEGVQFKDITTLLQNPEAFRYVIDTWVKRYEDKNVEVIVGADARGFIFGAPLAYALGIPFVPVRKPGKLPAATLSESYSLEYGENTLEIHKDAMKKGDRVLLVDDLLATGGTMGAMVRLVEQFDVEIVELAFVIELVFLGGAKLCGEHPVHSLVTYDSE